MSFKTKHNGKVIEFESSTECRLFESMLNDLRDVSFDQSQWGEGFILTLSGQEYPYPFCTCYVDKDRKINVYRAINDRWKGIALDDEELVGSRLTIGGAISCIRSLQMKMEGRKGSYFGRKEIYEGMNERQFCFGRKS